MFSKFEQLSKINVNHLIEEKQGLKYLSWAPAWDIFVSNCPDAEYDRLPYLYDDKLGYMVFTKVTTEGTTREMWLPVLDGANSAMKNEPYEYKVYNKFEKKYVTKLCDAADMFDINKAYMRCLVKNLGMFGLGLYIYKGEDLPTIDDGGDTVSIEKEVENKTVDEVRAIANSRVVPKIMSDQVRDAIASANQEQLNKMYTYLKEKCKPKKEVDNG